MWRRSASKWGAGPESDFIVDSNNPEFFQTPRQQLLSAQRFQFRQARQQFGLDDLCRQLMIAVGAAGRFGQDLVDNLDLHEIGGCQPQGFGGIGRLGLIAPENRRTAFGRNHRIPGVFQHQDPIADPDAKRTAGSAFADDGDDDRDFEAEHFEDIAGNGFGLAALLGFDAGEGAGGVDEDDDRASEAGGGLHQAQGLAVALGMHHPEVAFELLLGVAALLLADDQDFLVIEFGEAADHGFVVGIAAIAVEFDPISKDQLDVIQGVRALGMARQLHPLPAGQLGEDLGLKLLQFPFQGDDLGAQLQTAVGVKDDMQVL